MSSNKLVTMILPALTLNPRLRQYKNDKIKTFSKIHYQKNKKIDQERVKPDHIRYKIERQIRLLLIEVFKLKATARYCSQNSVQQYQNSLLHNTCVISC